MKNRFKLLLFSLFLSGVISAQTTGRLGDHATVNKWTPTTSFTTATQGERIAERIMDVVGLTPSFEMMPANIDNAAAVVYGGKRYVLYNPTFINNLIKTTGTDWAAVSVLAHEIGHHLNGHTVTGRGSQPALELEADEFSGFVLRKMGATLPQAQAAMKTLASAQASRTHPGQVDRLASIETGWNGADDQLAGRPARKKAAATTPKAVEQPATDVVVTRPRTTLNSRYILGDVFFNADPASTFHITTDYNLVKVSNGKATVLGKLLKTNSTQYPYVLADSQNTPLLVSSRGSILTRQGKQVGILKNHTS